MAKKRVVAKSVRVPPAPSIRELPTQAAQSGGSDSRKAAARASNSRGMFLSRFVYTTCYTVSYGVVFPAVFLAHSIPQNNAVVRGLIDGAHAASLKVDALRGKALAPA